MLKLDLEKAEEPQQIVNIHWIMEKAREFQKNIYFCFIDYAKAFDCVDHKKLENSSRDGNTRPPDLISITSDMQMTPPLWQKVKRS